ncbi:MAG: hypothetical protein ACJA09_002721 [Alcanivorax sp.]|jgi:hypothetical protein
MDGKSQGTRRNNNTGKVMYGISRIDTDRFRTHAWRVKLTRRGKNYVKNFPDKHWGGKLKALVQAKAFRDEFLEQHPPLSRVEYCSILRSNNQTGITGVYRYAKSFTLKNGEIKESWYWEATWPIGSSKQSHLTFPVNEYGEDKARQLAVRARKDALSAIVGHYWASARGAIE